MDHAWRVKRRRAQELLDEVRTEVARYLARPDVGLEYRYNAELNEIAVVVRGGEEPPDRLSAVIGDVLHNLRSALDSVAWAVAIRRGPLKKGEETSVYFPIVREPEDWKAEAKRKLPRVHPDEVEVFRRLQPWYWAEQAREHAVEVPIPAAKENALTRLDDLAKEDRHRTHLPVLARGGLTSLATKEGVTVEALPGDPPPWGPASTMLRWRLPDGVSRDDVYPDGSTLLVLTPSDALTETDVLRLLARISQEVLYATRVIESEVLGVVTAEDYEELARLRDESEQARERKIELVRNPIVTEGDVLSEYRRLTEEESAAWDRYRVRAREILGD